jgi:hypothetical protein
MELDLERVRDNASRATTEDLLDRVTVYREGMEPDALTIIEEELEQRGVGPVEIAAHEELRGNTLMGPEGWALKCHKCNRPAVVRVWGWHYLWGSIPVFPRWWRFCEQHRPAE